MHPGSALAGPRGRNLQQVHVYWTAICGPKVPTLYLADWGENVHLGALISHNLNHNNFKKMLKKKRFHAELPYKFKFIAKPLRVG